MSSSYHTFRIKKPSKSHAPIDAELPSQDISTPVHRPIDETDEIPKTDTERLDLIFQALKKTKWKLGDFLNVIFEDTNHEYQGIVSKFLSGKSKVKAASIVRLMYEHSSSRPKSKVAEETAVHYAQPAIFAWALDTVIQKMTTEVKKLVRDPELRIRASRKGAVHDLLSSVVLDQLVSPNTTHPLNSGGRGSDNGLGGAVEVVMDADAEIEDAEMGNVGIEREEEEESDLELDVGGVMQSEEDEGRKNPLEPASMDGSTADPGLVPLVKPRVRGKGKDSLVSWGTIEKFSLVSLKEKYQDNAPTVWRVLSQLACGEKKPSRLGGIYRPKDIVLTSVLSGILYTRNQYCNLFALCMSLAMFAMKAHHSMFRLGSRLGYCMPFSTIRNALVTMAADIRKYLKSNPHLHNLWVVFDNIQQYVIRRDRRIGSTNEMVIGTGATAVIMEDCPPDAFDAEPYIENLRRGERRDLTAKKLESDLDWEHMARVSEFHFIDILVQFVPSLEVYRAEVKEVFKDLLMKHQINPTRKTTIHPLGTNDANEVSLKGMKEALADIIDQTGITEDSLKSKLHFMSGDGKSFQTMGDFKKIISDQRSEDKTLIALVEILELWHTKWTELCRILINQFGDKNVKRDPSSLRFLGQVVGIPPPSKLAKADFYNSSQLLNIAVKAHVLRFWEVHLGTSNIVDYFEDLASVEKLPTLDDLREIARQLAQQYSTSRAYDDALRNDGPMNMMSDPDKEDDDDGESVISEEGEKGDETEMLTGDVDESEPLVQSLLSLAELEPEDVPMEGNDNDGLPESEAAAGQQTTGTDGEKFEGDWPLANSILLVRDGIWWLEFCRAVSIGDTGRVWEVLKFWIFQFAGASNPNYTNYLLEMYCKIKYEFPKGTKDALFQNWLVNLSGKEEGFIELDFMQERFNLLLEEFSKHKGQEFSNPWYRLVIAMHVHRFLRLKEEMENMVDLVPRRKAHSEPHLDNEFNEVLRIFREWGIHKFKAGRDLGHHAQDQFARGMAQLSKERIKKFLERSMQGRVNLEDVREMDGSFSDPPARMYHPHFVQYDDRGSPYFSNTTT